MDKESLQRWEEVIEGRSFRVGEENTRRTREKNPRNQYQRDFDRLIFSSSFKRLQNKTQVFPLPGTAQVHNRLTHSLEVSSVGRSLGSLVGNEIADLLKSFSPEVVNFYRYELKDVILAACLAHDIGNPCFGHSGEKILSDYFTELKENHSRFKGREGELEKITEMEWRDLTHFEGNANTLRVLTAHYYGKLPGGLRLTYLTLASILKYPWDAEAMVGRLGKAKGKKYGFFQEQKDLVKEIASTLHIRPDSSEGKGVVFCRHPFVYLVEAADDICYYIMDMEDAQKLGIFSGGEVKEYFRELYREVSQKFFPGKEDFQKILHKEAEIKNEREKIVYLRSKCINALTVAAARVFINHRESMVGGKAEDLLTLMTDEHGIRSLEEIKKVSVEKIYHHSTVSETMVGASHIFPELLDWFLPAILVSEKGSPTYSERTLFRLIDAQFTGGDLERFIEKERPYTRILSLLDFLTGMTDEYITELYRKLRGIDRVKHSL